MKNDKAKFFKMKYKSMLLSTLISYAFLTVELVIDSAIAGMFIGEDAVSAIGIVSPYITFISFVSTMISQGCGIIFTQKIGAYKDREAKMLCGMGLGLSFALGVILTILMLCTKNIFLGFFNLSPEIYRLASDYFTYLTIIAFIYPVYYLVYYLVLDDGDNILVTASDIICIIVNFIASMIFVSNMGIAGLALGTSLGNCVSFLILLNHFGSKKNNIKFILSFNFKELVKILKVGLPVTCATLYAAILDIIMNKFIISNFGDMYLPAYSIANLILNACQILSATVTAAGPMLCVYYREKNSVGVKKAYNIVYKTTKIAGIVGALLCIGLSPVIPRLYAITTPSVLSASINTCWILGLTMIPTAFGFLYLQYYSYVDEEKIATTGGAIYSFIGPIILAPICAKMFGYNGIAIGLALCPIVAEIYYYLAIKIKHYKKSKKISTKELMMCLPEAEGEILDYCININDKEIIELRDNVGEDLLVRNVKPSLIKKVQLMIEETYELIKEKNMVNGKVRKRHISECNVIVTDKYVKLITRDNGVIFDITNGDNEIKSLRCYIVANFMENVDDKSYLLTSSFNRNSYVFEKQKLV